MKLITVSIRTVASALALSAVVALAQNNKNATPAKAPAGKLVPITDKDTAWAAKAKAEYPTEMCVVSDDKVGDDHGTPVDMIYRVAGKPDRLISFCCKDCVKEFNEDPQKFLKVLDNAAAKKKDAHSEHEHTEHKH